MCRAAELVEAIIVGSAIALTLKLTLVAFGAFRDDAPGYPDAPFAKIAAQDGWARPRAKIEGKVELVKHEADGDWHIALSDGHGHKVICEIIPELPMKHPKVGDKIRVWGIPRWDGEHKWGELHPVIGWEPSK